MSSSLNNSETARKVALVAAIAAGLLIENYVNNALAGTLGAGYALYYIASRKKNLVKEECAELSKLAQMTPLDLKELGNKLFGMKKYSNAIDAIESCGNGADELAAICFQNRAASRELMSGSLDDIIIDCSEAIKRKPSYGKAYLRRGRNLFKNKQVEDALIDIFSATHLEPNIDRQVATDLEAISSVLENIEKEVWILENKPHDRKVPVRHERVYCWLHRFGESDKIRNDIRGAEVGAGPYLEAVSFVREKKYTEVADKAAQSAVDEAQSLENKLKGCLLAARFYYLQNQRNLGDDMLLKFNKEFSELLEPDQDLYSPLLKLRECLIIEFARDKEEVLSALEHAIAKDSTYSDFYAVAAFRLMQLSCVEEARAVFDRKGFEMTLNMELASQLVNILLGVKRQDYSGIHEGMLKLEKLINDLEKPNAYALSMLAKVYTLFQNSDDAKNTMNKLVELEPNESIHAMHATSEEEMCERLQRCLELEPYHSEANLVLCTIRVHSIGPKALSAEDFQFCWELLERATKICVPDSVDFPVPAGIFRMRAILKAKRAAGERFGI